MLTTGTQAPVPAVAEGDPGRKLLTTRVRRGMGWLYWIAGVSALNTLLYRLGVNLCFVVGLGATQLVDGFSVGLGTQAGAGGRALLFVVACAIDLFLLGAYCLAARSMQRGGRKLLLAAFAFYALDTLIFLRIGAWMSVVFHGVALSALWMAFQALGELARSPAAEAGGTTAIQPPPLPTFSLGGVPNFDEPDPDAPKPKGLFARVEGMPALIVGLVLLGSVVVFAVSISKF